MLKTQLILKGIVSEDDWNGVSGYIKYDFIQDGYFSEMKEQEIRQSRLDQAERIFNQQMIGKIFSMNYVLKKVLRMTDLEIEQQREEIKKEIEDGLIKDPYNDDAQDGFN
jgi:trans-2-enoyl-CoA reductase